MGVPWEWGNVGMTATTQASRTSRNKKLSLSQEGVNLIYSPTLPQVRRSIELADVEVTWSLSIGP